MGGKGGQLARGRGDHEMRDGLVGTKGLLAVGGDFGARLVNDDHDADGGGNLLQAQAVWARALVEDAADGIGERGHFAHAPGHVRDPFVIQFQPVQHCRGKSGFSGGFHVQVVGLLNGGAVRLDRVGHRQQAGAFLGSGQLRQRAGCLAGLAAQAGNLFSQSHRGKLRQRLRRCQSCLISRISGADCGASRSGAGAATPSRAPPRRFFGTSSSALGTAR